MRSVCPNTNTLAHTHTQILSYMRTWQTLQNFNLKFSTSSVRVCICVCGQKVWLPGKIFAKNEKLCKKKEEKQKKAEEKREEEEIMCQHKLKRKSLQNLFAKLSISFRPTAALSLALDSHLHKPKLKPKLHKDLFGHTRRYSAFQPCQTRRKMKIAVLKGRNFKTLDNAPEVMNISDAF